MRFALEWTHLSLPEKQARMFGVTAGEMEDIQNLLYYAFKIYLHQESAHLQNVLFIYWSVRPQKNEERVEGVNSGGEWSEEAPCRLTKWREVLWHYYNVNFDEELYQWTKEASQQRCSSVDILTEGEHQLTAHELLETQLVLQEWCKKAGLSEQFEALVKP